MGRTQQMVNDGNNNNFLNSEQINLLDTGMVSFSCASGSACPL